ncbi:alpha/beta hydrolase [Streptomyces sp. NPDC046994]|uniref:alpha/beta hydrolase n=1 Tax=Streptomyces sp. NPDC046994 TaxID=3155735 RepID=UPI00345456FA
MMSTHTRTTVTTATAAAAVLALLGAALPSVTEAGGGPDLSRFYGQRITWSACPGEKTPGDRQCGKVTVPIDYAKPDAGTIDVAMTRYRATAGSRGSVLLNFGGPGGAGVPELAAGGKDFLHLTNAYDVVTFDPRGVGQSSPVSCVEKAANNADAEDTVIDVTDPRAALAQIRKTADQCARHSGPLLPHMGTVDVARDMDVMRQALGDKKLNYLGFSYGTRLGAVYAAQFPGKVGRMVLDGVDTLTESLAEQGLVGAQGQQTALESFLDSCVKNLLCPFGSDARSAREQVVQLVARLDKQPASTALGQPFTGQDLVAGISELLFSKRMWPMLEQGLAQLMEQGDPSGIMYYSGLGISAPSVQRANGGIVAPDNVPVDNMSAALMAVNCADDPDRPSADRITKDIKRLRDQYDEASPVFGRYRLTQVLTCYGRPKGTDFIREKVKNVHSAKMLLVGTRGDPATPYRWALETAKRLGPSAVVLDNRGEGHTGYTTSPCVHRKVDAFLLYGSLPADGSSCGPDTAG